MIQEQLEFVASFNVIDEQDNLAADKSQLDDNECEHELVKLITPIGKAVSILIQIQIDRWQDLLDNKLSEVLRVVFRILHVEHNRFAEHELLQILDIFGDSG